MFIASADAAPMGAVRQAADETASPVETRENARVQAQEAEIPCDLLWLGRLLCCASALVTLSLGAAVLSYALG